MEQKQPSASLVQKLTLLVLVLRTADDVTLTWTWLVGLKPEAVAER